METAFETLLEKLEKKRLERVEQLRLSCTKSMELVNKIKLKEIEESIEIVKQTAEEYNTGWIPCSERLPEEAFGCLVTVMDCEPSTQTDFENILPYFVGYDGHGWNDADGEEIPFEVIAWKKLPAPYQPNEKQPKRTNFDRCCESMEATAQIIDTAKIGWTKEQIIEWLKKEECPVPD